MIEKHIEEALQHTGFDVYYLNRPSQLQENIVYTYTFKPAFSADNEVKAYQYTVLLNIYCNYDRDITNIRNEIMDAMKQGGFKIQPVPIPQREGDYINIALRFKINK